jgi:hypothetical protein
MNGVSPTASRNLRENALFPQQLQQQQQQQQQQQKTNKKTKTATLKKK